MSSLRIVRLAALVCVTLTPISLFAQALTPASSAVAAGAAIDALVSPYSAPTPLVLTLHTARLPLRSELALDTDAGVTASMGDVVDRAIYKSPRKRVADFAMTLRDIRYRRAGHDPSTGFDCSGFTHYVYSQTYGLELPYDAPSQFHSGDKVARDDLKVGDLVFFAVRNHITHVGIYMGDGTFIHSPSPGKRVRVDELASSYWAKRYAGARRVHVS